jgi:glycosyltransferase involved in cell wall biosynthesis
MSAHIAIYTDDPDKGGVAQYNDRLATALAAAGYRITLIQTRTSVAQAAAREAAGIGHRWIAYDTQKDFPRTIADTADAEAAFAELRPDVILFSDCCPVSNIAGKQVAIRRGIPFVTVVNFVAPYLAERFQACLRVTAQQMASAREVVAVSTENLGLLRRLFGLPADRGRVIFYGVSEKFFGPRDEKVRSQVREKLKIAPGTMVSLTAARLSGVKLHALQIHAMDLLQAQRAAGNIVSVWIGEGELRAQLEAEIARRGLQDRFILVGQQQEVLPWYDAADVFTLTSQSEGMPIAIMEAMARGLPVVATAVSGIPEQLEGVGALLASPEKNAALAIKQLAETWRIWSNDPAKRREAGRQCRARAERLFRLETMVEQTREALDCALTEARAV